MKTTAGQIKEKAKELFLAHGTKTISMDDIAEHLGISKKTIYQFFPGKNELVYTMVEDLVQSYEQLFETSRNSSKDAIDEVLQQDRELLKTWAGIRPSFIFELEKYFHDAFDLLIQYKSYILDNTITNLERGKEEGLYRSDVDILLISDLRMHQLVNILKPELLTSHPINMTELAKEFTQFYLQSITTDKGRKLLYKYLNQGR